LPSASILIETEIGRQQTAQSSVYSWLPAEQSTVSSIISQQ